MVGVTSVNLGGIEVDVEDVADRLRRLKVPRPSPWVLTVRNVNRRHRVVFRRRAQKRCHRIHRRISSLRQQVSLRSPRARRSNELPRPGHRVGRLLLRVWATATINSKAFSKVFSSTRPSNTNHIISILYSQFIVPIRILTKKLCV